MGLAPPMALALFLQQNVVGTERGAVLPANPDDTVVRVEYADFDRTQTAVNAALSNYTGTLLPVEYVQGVFTQRQWDNIVKDVKALPEVQKHSLELGYIHRPLDQFYVFVGSQEEIPEVRDALIELGYGPYVRYESGVPLRIPISL